MPRTARVAPRDAVYHILTRGNNRQNIFNKEKDYKKYIKILKKYKEKYQFILYHYVLMTNHIHLILEVTEKGGSLAEIMKGINLSYALYYKGKYEYIGHFWQDRYKSILISKDEYLISCGGYVELNPVRAKIVEDPKEYEWSSYNVYAYGKVDAVVEEHPIYRELSKEKRERRKKYRELIKCMLKEKDALSGEMNGRVVYGNLDFIKRMKKEYNVEAVIKPRGRQKKKKNEIK
jgi:putative transposase